MKKSLMIAGATLALGLGVPTVQMPAADTEPATGSTEKHMTRAERKAADLQKYDANKNSVLDKDELAARKADRDAAKQAELLAKYDANKNGKLDPEEESVLKADKEKAAQERAAKKHAKEQAKAGDS